MEDDLDGIEITSCGAALCTSVKISGCRAMRDRADPLSPFHEILIQERQDAMAVLRSFGIGDVLVSK